MITGTVIGDKEVVAYFDAMPAAVRAAVLAKTRSLSIALARYIQEDKLSGQVLKVRSGNLRRSIFATTVDGGDVITGKVQSSGDVKYAAIHEYGGVIKHPGGTAYVPTPKAGAMMLFVANKNAQDWMPRTKAHDIKMPERSFMRTGLADQKESIITGLKEALLEGLK